MERQRFECGGFNLAFETSCVRKESPPERSETSFYFLNPECKSGIKDPKTRKALVRFGCKRFLPLVENRGFWFLRFLLFSVSPDSGFEPTSKKQTNPDEAITRISNFSCVA